MRKCTIISFAAVSQYLNSKSVAAKSEMSSYFFTSLLGTMCGRNSSCDSIRCFKLHLFWKMGKNTSYIILNTWFQTSYLGS